MMKQFAEEAQDQKRLNKKKSSEVIEKITISALRNLHSILRSTFYMECVPKLSPYDPYEMTKMGGAWIGHRHRWPDIRDSEIRLEIFYHTPPQLLEYFNHQFELTYPDQLGTSLHPTFSTLDDRQLVVIEGEVIAYIDKKQSDVNQALVVEVTCNPVKLTTEALNYLLKEVQRFCKSKNLMTFEVYLTIESNKLPTTTPGLTIKKFNLRYQEYILCGDLHTHLEGSTKNSGHIGLSVANQENPYYKKYLELKSKLARQRITFSLRDNDNTFLGFAVFEVPAHVLNFAHLGLLFLDPSIRGTGNGAKLLSTVESYLEKINIFNIRLTSPHYMAHTFYPTQGYTEIDRMPWPKENLYLFFKPLSSKPEKQEMGLCSPKVVEHILLL